MASGEHQIMSKVLDEALRAGDRVTTRVSLVVDPVFFKLSTKEAWGFGENAHAKTGFRAPVPETWIKPVPGMAPSVLALVSCPKCKAVKLIDNRIHVVTPNCEIHPNLLCHCGFHRRAFLDRWLKKPLYACAIEYILPGKDVRGQPRISKDIVYVSADNQSEAMIQCGPGNYRFVAVAPAIGFFTADSEGKNDRALVGDARGFAPEPPKPPRSFGGI